jgi:hypothetical protein
MESVSISKESKTSLLLACGAIGCPLFILMFLLEGVLRSDDYSSLRFPISSLSLGYLGWMQRTSFLLNGMLLVAFAAGLRKWLPPFNGAVRGVIPIALVGVGLIGAGICNTDPVYGYPTNLPLKLAQFSLHGHFHDGFSILVFVFLPIACFKFRKRFLQLGETGWATYTAFTGFAMPVVFVLTSLGFKQVPGFVEFAGLTQRLTLVIGWTWLTLLSIHITSRQRAMNKKE